MKAHFFIIIIAFLVFGCRNSKKDTPLVSSDTLFPIDYSDTMYEGVYQHDTITEDGWKIEYLVKDDSTKYSDIYIRWSKGNSVGVYKGATLLLMRRYFIPSYEGETESYLYFYHGCATGCAAVLALSKEDEPKARDFDMVHGYDISLDQVLYQDDEMPSDYSDVCTLVLIDLKRNIQKSISDTSLCLHFYLQFEIDTVEFSEEKVTIKTIDHRDNTIHTSTLDLTE